MVLVRRVVVPLALLLGAWIAFWVAISSLVSATLGGFAAERLSPLGFEYLVGETIEGTHVPLEDPVYVLSSFAEAALVFGCVSVFAGWRAHGAARWLALVPGFALSIVPSVQLFQVIVAFHFPMSLGLTVIFQTLCAMLATILGVRLGVNGLGKLHATGA